MIAGVSDERLLFVLCIVTVNKLAERVGATGEFSDGLKFESRAPRETFTFMYLFCCAVLLFLEKISSLNNLSAEYFQKISSIIGVRNEQHLGFASDFLI